MTAKNTTRNTTTNRRNCWRNSVRRYNKETKTWRNSATSTEFSNINDETGLKRAYNNKTDLGLYHHLENKTLYIAGTKDFPRDILDDTLIPFHMVHRSKRYKTANDCIRNNIDNVDTIVQSFLGFSNNDETEPRLQQEIYHQNLWNTNRKF